MDFLSAYACQGYLPMLSKSSSLLWDSPFLKKSVSSTKCQILKSQSWGVVMHTAGPEASSRCATFRGSSPTTSGSGLARNARCTWACQSNDWAQTAKFNPSQQSHTQWVRSSEEFPWRINQGPVCLNMQSSQIWRKLLLFKSRFH